MSVRGISRYDAPIPQIVILEYVDNGFQISRKVVIISRVSASLSKSPTQKQAETMAIGKNKRLPRKKGKGKKKMYATKA